MSVSILVGNPHAQSRTLRVAEAVAQQLVELTGATDGVTVDLADVASDVFDWTNGAVTKLNEAIAASSIVVVASPTYKAAYTGLLKAFLDRYGADGLAGVTAVPVMTGGSPAHTMAVETTLRPLLVELGASVPTRGLYYEIERYPDVAATVAEWAESNLAPYFSTRPSALA